MENNQQYKWRQRKKRNHFITVWIILVILLGVAGTFVYEGTREMNPLTVAEKYFKQEVGVSDFTVVTGERSLNADNQFVQEYTFTYTADGQEKSETVSMTQQNDKKYGLFNRWGMSSTRGAQMDLELIAPASSQVLINGVAPDASSIKTDETLSPGAVCYQLTGVDISDNKLQINGLPFDSYEGTLDGSSSVVDIRDRLVVGENAQTQMLEIGKSMIHELFTAVVDQTGSEKLGDLFAKAANKDNLYKAIERNLYQDGELKVESLTFEGFKPEFGEVYYPGNSEESYIGMEMKLSYTCKYELAGSEESESETEAAETESESETEAKKSSAEKSAGKTATFYFEYRDGNCTVRTIEVPNAL
ncbi:MAG: hypothetical protein Q4B57_05140 [Eubacteriales bacterium]|nr:hypothetical protein [Eubacteriales bacterium]